MNFMPVRGKQTITLPDPWPTLRNNGFHADLTERARRFKMISAREQFIARADEILIWAGEGFMKPFDRTEFEPAHFDRNFRFKTAFLNALDTLAEEFNDRIPSVVWDALAFMGTRPNPHEEATIPSQQEYLTMHFGLADAILHALPKVYGLMLHVQSRIFEHTGTVLEHSCDCSHAAKPLQKGSVVCCFLNPEKFTEATNALFTHLLCEAKLIMVDGLPFNFGLSPEFEAAQEREHARSS